MAVKVFVSYSHADDGLRAQLEEHFAQLRREGRIEAWTDRRIPPGGEWGAAIDEALEAAEIVLLLVSASFLDSDYCNDVELERALARHEAGTARVIPVIVRPCDWLTASFGKLQALPRDGKPVTGWEDRDEAWLDVVRGLRKQVTRPSAGAPPGGAGSPGLSGPRHDPRQSRRRAFRRSRRAPAGARGPGAAPAAGGR